MANFGVLTGIAKREMSDYLEKYDGNKVLVWDEAVMGRLDLIVDNNFLREHQVVKMFTLKPGRLPSFGSLDVENIVFVTRPEVGNMDLISDNVKGEEIREPRRGRENSKRLDFHIIFTPSLSFLCEMRLKDRGVFGSFRFLDELSIWWLPLDGDVISMERNSVFRDYFLDQDPTCLHDVAKAMISFQAVYGFIPQIYGKGIASKQLCDYMLTLRKEMLNEENTFGRSPQFDTLIILDRQVDLISPLMTQLTYEGLIDESFKINNNKVTLPVSTFTTPKDGPSGSGTDVKQVVLSSSEELYAELRDKNFNAVGPFLNKKIKATEAQEGERHRAKTVRELRLFVDKMPQIEATKQSLSKHISLATLIKEITDSEAFLEFLRVEQDLVNYQDVHKPLEFVEDACCQELDLVRVLRVICLQSVIGFGLKPKVIEAYRRLILHCYGHSHLLSLINLEKAGMLTKQQGGSGNAANYAVLRKRLSLTRSDDDEQNPKDISYVHCVYAPLSVRLVQNCTHPCWKSIRDVLDMLPGPTFEETQKPLSSLQRDGQYSNQKDEQKTSQSLKRTLVLYVGGCTFAEIAALRFLSQQEDATTEYMVATTSVINGNNFIENLMTKLDDPLAFEVRR